MLTRPPTREADARPDSPATAILRDAFVRLFAGIDAGIAVTLADDTPLYTPRGPVAATIVLGHPGVLRSLLTRTSDLAAGEAMVRGDIDVRGDVEAAFAGMDAVAAARTPKDWLAVAALIAKLPRVPGAQPSGRGPARLRGRLHSLERDRSAVQYHYDVSNEFYALWLGDDMTYSCAYFRDESETLDEAQANKHEHICRKLQLKPGERLLDIGCGWGGLVRFAAREHGAKAVGITLSRKQFDYARRRIEAEGLSESCTVELLDYRELSKREPFDKIASVGMVEHVGDAMLQTYFDSAYDALVPGGLFLNHGIIMQRARPRTLAARFFPTDSRFIETYVFPDGEIPRLEAMTQAAQDAGFEVRDVENLREHYARTLRCWLRGLEGNATQARTLVGNETYNTWRFYVAGSARGFAAGRMGVVQMLLAKRTPDGRASVPLTRAGLYRPA